MTRRSLTDLLDDSVRWTGIPDLAMRKPRRRPQRVPSTLGLVLATLGMVIAFAQPQLPWLSFGLIMIGNLFGNFAPVFGPLKPWGNSEPADERERALRSKAYLVTLSVLAGSTFASLWLMIGLSVVDAWAMERLRWALICLTFFLMTITVAGPTCYASWAERPLEPEEG